MVKHQVLSQWICGAAGLAVHMTENVEQIECYRTVNDLWSGDLIHHYVTKGHVE